MIPTKRGLGVELWGSYESLCMLYDVIGTFWGSHFYNRCNIKENENRDDAINAFSYEIRKCYQGSRLKRIGSHFYPSENTTYFGTRISFTHFLISLSALKENLKYAKPDKYELSIFLQLEHWLEHAMFNYDANTAEKLLPFINGAIDAENEYLYQFLLILNAEYVALGGGKRNFKKLPDLLKATVRGTKEYESLVEYITNIGVDNDIDPTDLIFDYSKMGIYDNLRW
ncbi:DUF6904 family protein [Raineya sp.]